MICFLFQSPPKGATIPYRPKPQVGGPVILAGGQAFTIQGNYAVPAHSDVSTVMQMQMPTVPAMGHAHPPSLNSHNLTASPFAAHHPSSPFAASNGHPFLPAHLNPHHPLQPLHANVAGLADPLLKSGHLQAALPPAHLVADVVSLLFFVIHPLPNPKPPESYSQKHVRPSKHVSTVSIPPLQSLFFRFCPPPTENPTRDLPNPKSARFSIVMVTNKGS